ncbi:hypothetical protein D3C85_877160 [compost metagenome]
MIVIEALGYFFRVSTQVYCHESTSNLKGCIRRGKLSSRISPSNYNSAIDKTNFHIQVKRRSCQINFSADDRGLNIS